MSRDMIFPTIWYVRPTKAQNSLRICICQSLRYYLTVKLLTKQHLEFVSLKEGCTCSWQSTHGATLLELTCRGSSNFEEKRTWTHTLKPCLHRNLLFGSMTNNRDFNYDS